MTLRAFLREVRLGERPAARSRACLDVPEVPAGEFEHVIRDAVAGDDEHGVRGRVVAVVEVRRILGRRVLEVGEVPVAVVGVRVAVERERRQGDPREAPVWPVQDVDLDLLLDDGDLVVEVLLGYCEGSHAVGLQPQSEVQPSGGKRLVVRREVGERVPVDYAAGALDELHVLDLPDVS